MYNKKVCYFVICIIVFFIISKYSGYFSFEFLTPIITFPFKNRFKLYNSKNKLISNIFHEPIEQALIAKYLKKTDSVLELGGNIGGASILIDKIVEKHHVVFEPSDKMVKFLEKNKKYHNCKYKIIDGILSKSKKMYLHGSGLGLYISPKISNRKVKTFLFEPLNKQYNFTTLIADCEGSLVQIFNDFPTIFDNMRLVIFEKDGHCDYNIITDKLKKLKFKNVVNTFHDVWVKDN